MLRRNGKLRSCEPCRISKIRCDHATPICSRCQQRGMTEQCIYHPAPMTKPAGTPRKQPEPRRRVLKEKHSEARVSRNHGNLTPTLLSPTTSARSDGLNGWPSPPDSRATQSLDPARGFFLGSTSYASVFAEEGDLPESIHSNLGRAEHSSTSIIGDVENPSAAHNKVSGTRFCRFGLAQPIISALTPFSLFEKSAMMYIEGNKMSYLLGPLVTSLLPQLKIDLEQLASAGTSAYKAYAEITRNTMQPLKVPPTMLASEFHTLLTGPNLRWETLGLILIVAGSQAQFTSPDSPIFLLEDGQRIDRDDFVKDMIHTSTQCISLCKVHGAVNDVVVWLIYINMLVTTCFYGDNYHGGYRRMGDCISALYAEGLHCEATYDEPFFLRESRRRLVAAVYRSDKSIATFFGRPPMMVSRYSDRKLPLDLDDKTVTSSDPQVISEALAELDNEGWNTERKIHAASWIRMRFHCAVLKERFLEQSLAGEKNDSAAQQIQAISTECRQTWESFPSHLRYDLHDEDSVWTNMDPSITLRMISVYLEYLHMEFCMQRSLRRHTQVALPALLEISMRLLSTVLVFNKHRNQEYSIQRHFPTLMLLYCLPSAGVLALELRRCTRENVPLPSTVARADVIRNLSVFISCLDWVILPGDGNHKLCSELNKMLALVLDDVLNYQPPAVESQGDGNSNAPLDGVSGPFFDLPALDGMEPIPTESEDFLNWLDNANWSNTYLF